MPSDHKLWRQLQKKFETDFDQTGKHPIQLALNPELHNPQKTEMRIQTRKEWSPVPN